MGMILNDEKVCPLCGAYENTNGFCSNGHVITNLITRKEYEKNSMPGKFNEITTAKKEGLIVEDCKECGRYGYIHHGEGETESGEHYQLGSCVWCHSDNNKKIVS